MKLFVSLSGLWLIWCLLEAQTPYIQDGPIGKVKDAGKEQPVQQAPASGWPVFRTLPTSQWVGKRIIFRPYQGSEELRHFGYQGWVRESPGKLYGSTSYEELSGKIGQIITVQPATYPSPQVVTVALEGSEAHYTGVVFNNLGGVTFLDEIDQARKELVGKTAWIVSPLLDHLVTYDAKTHLFSPTPVKRLSPVTIVNVVVGSEGASIKGWLRAAIDIVAPARLILRTERRSLSRPAAVAASPRSQRYKRTPTHSSQSDFLYAQDSALGPDWSKDDFPRRRSQPIDRLAGRNV